MKFIVQDLQKTVDTAPDPICDDAQVAQRISLQVHDFFTEQTVKGADGTSRFYLIYREKSLVSRTDDLFIWHSLLLSLDHAQPLKLVRRQDPSSFDPSSETGSSYRHQRSVPP